MAKRAVVVAVAVLILTGQGTAGAGTSPRWPCEVTVSIDAGPLHRVGVNALRQLDDATRITWVLVADDGMVQVHWRHPDFEGAVGNAAVAASDRDIVGAEVTIDPEAPRAMRLTVVLHELGHVAGLGHSDDPDSVMRPGADGVPWKHYGPGDLDALGKVPCGRGRGVR